MGNMTQKQSNIMINPRDPKVGKSGSVYLDNQAITETSFSGQEHQPKLFQPHPGKGTKNIQIATKQPL